MGIFTVASIRATEEISGPNFYVYILVQGFCITRQFKNSDLICQAMQFGGFHFLGQLVKFS